MNTFENSSDYDNLGAEIGSRIGTSFEDAANDNTFDVDSSFANPLAKNKKVLARESQGIVRESQSGAFEQEGSGTQSPLSEMQKKQLEKDRRKAEGFQSENPRQALFIFLDEPDSSALARLWSLVMIGMILLSTLMIVIETRPHYKYGGCVDSCEQQLVQGDCSAHLGGLCEWIVDDKGTDSLTDDVQACKSYAGKARLLNWNDVSGFSITNRDDLYGGDADFHQCSENAYTGDWELEEETGTLEPTEADKRICEFLTDPAVVYQTVTQRVGNTTVKVQLQHVGKMKGVCQFEPNEGMQILYIFEAVAILSFTVEYVLRVATCTERPSSDQSFLGYLIQPFNIIDVLTVLPWYVELLLGGRSSFSILRMLRMARIFRVLKAANFMHEIHLFLEGYKQSRDGLMLLMCMLLFYLCIFGSVLYLCEYDIQTELCFGDDGCGHAECWADHDDGIYGKVVGWKMPIDCDGLSNKPLGAELSADDLLADGSSPGWSDDENGFMRYSGDAAHLESNCRTCCADCVKRGFTSILTTWYFILATMTTVGYGDHYPESNWGKFITTTCMMAGILVMALPIIVIGGGFETVFSREEAFKRERADAEKMKLMERMELKTANAATVEEMRADMTRRNKKTVDAEMTCHGLICILESMMDELGTINPDDVEVRQKLDAAIRALE
jgi:hypothetical protein